MNDLGPGHSADLGGMDMLLAGLLATFLGQLLMFFKPFHPAANGWRQGAYRLALAARMLFIVLLVRVLFRVILSQ